METNAVLRCLLAASRHAQGVSLVNAFPALTFTPGWVNEPFTNGQNKASLLGTMLPLDVNITTLTAHYTIPAGNPLAGGTSGVYLCRLSISYRPLTKTMSLIR